MFVNPVATQCERNIFNFTILNKIFFLPAYKIVRQ